MYLKYCILRKCLLCKISCLNQNDLITAFCKQFPVKFLIPDFFPLQDLTVHDSLAMKICNEILMDPTVPDVRIYAKALNSLELSSSSTENLLVLLNEILEVIHK